MRYRGQKIAIQSMRGFLIKNSVDLIQLILCLYLRKSKLKRNKKKPNQLKSNQLHKQMTLKESEMEVVFHRQGIKQSNFI